jgi:hypothetical protein
MTLSIDDLKSQVFMGANRERERERGVELTGGGAVAKPAMASGMSGGWEGERNVSSSV